MSRQHEAIPVGTVFGRLTTLDAPTQLKGKGNVMYLCECDCGSKDAYYYSHKLKSGWTRSCGCFRSEETAKRNKGL